MRRLEGLPPHGLPPQPQSMPVPAPSDGVYPLPSALCARACSILGVLPSALAVRGGELRDDFLFISMSDPRLLVELREEQLWWHEPLGNHLLRSRKSKMEHGEQKRLGMPNSKSPGHQERCRNDPEGSRGFEGRAREAADEGVVLRRPRIGSARGRAAHGLYPPTHVVEERPGTR